MSFDQALPISGHVEEIARLIQTNQVVIVAGETGSGKTTQLPKICLLAGRQRIGHTQPRRIAARSVAERIADEMATPLGELVGYQVRFTKSVGEHTRIKVMTDGIMLAEIAQDRDLRRYDTIIIDEAHERSLNIDFLLGYLKQLITRRSELRVIITSATIDTARFAAHFDDAPIVEVSGRSYPVEVRYRPLDHDGDSDDPGSGVVRAARELIATGPGDILVFCAGERDIRDTIAALAAAEIDADFLALHARLSAGEQRQIFLPHRRRRIIVATNIAETSLTVPGIRYVIDTGLARISRYSPRTKVQRLPIEPISRASADQRVGRCGRVTPGIAIRLYDEEDYHSRPAFTEPEILRTNLARVILAMARARLGQIVDFPFVEPPDSAQVADGLRLLRELGAIKASPTTSEQVRLTRTGHLLADLPIDPRLGRMLIEASRRGCLREVQVIVAFLAIQDLRERPAQDPEPADRLHARFFSDAILDPSNGLNPQLPTPPAQVSPAGRAHKSQPTQPLRHTPHTSKTARYRATSQPRKPTPVIEVASGGDIQAIWRMWRYLRERRRTLSGNQFRKLCQAEYLNYLRYREWQDLHTQLKQICQDLDLERNQAPATPEVVTISVLSGLLSHIGLRQPRPETPSRVRRPMTEYLGPRGTRFAIQPGSALARRSPDLVVAVELVETSRLWARTVEAIEAEWVEDLGAHLIKRGFGEPYWSTAQGAALVDERVMLLGVPIIAGRRTHYARINPAQAREFFIRSALVEGKWEPRPIPGLREFWARNRTIIEKVTDVADRMRGQVLWADDQDIFAFYDRRLPDKVTSQASFERWWRTNPDPHCLDMTPEALAEGGEIAAAKRAFPDSWGELRLPVSYIFAPGHERDGATVTITLAQLNQVRAETFTWQVPGLREELATELIRSLPKPVRTHFIPAPDHARAALRWLEGHQPDQRRAFWLELGRALSALGGEPVAEQDWHPEAVPRHLRVGFEITGGGKVRYGEDLAQMQRDLAQEITRTITRAASRQAPATSWTFGDLPEHSVVRHGSVEVRGYPALADQGDAVSMVMAVDERAQAMTHRRGIRRLLVTVNPDPTRWVVGHLGNSEKLALPSSCYPSVPALLADARLKAVGMAAWRFQDPATVRDRASFERLALQVRQVQADVMRQVVATAAEVAVLDRQVREVAHRLDGGEQILADLENLVFDGYISFTRDPWFQRIPSYLTAMIARCEAAGRDGTRDARLIAPIEDLLAEFDDLCAGLPAGSLPDEVDDIGFWIEELRVQTFNQRLGTIVPVSTKRIRRAMDRVRADSL